MVLATGPILITLDRWVSRIHFECKKKYFNAKKEYIKCKKEYILNAKKEIMLNAKKRIQGDHEQLYFMISI